MAQLIRAQCRGKPLFNGEATLIGFEPKSKIRFVSTTTTKLLSSASSSVSSSPDDYKFREDVSNVDDSGFCNVGYDLFFDDPEFGRDELSCFRGLVLDISYRPVNVVCWKRAICLEFMDKADVLEYYDQTVNSPSGSFYIPAVLRVPHLLQVVKRRRIRSTLSRKNVLARDNFTCQYCSSSENLTIDHVVPTARGGEWTWENLVTACSRCNNRKGQKILEEANMKLKKIPKAPKDYDIIAIPLTNSAIQMLKMGKQTPEEWHEYLA
ncbi:hypothetical protein DCAR_0310920 [Daucus carota subsp. sativus]|uniref:HNH nuclease domain-containing protein n=1 Tax=Daucus carota subsp. sativus TaxID=79200 RepID=A0A162AHC8_DAUCS|nr:PREDICTED: uncharacterized protein LOC108213744 [Daucus carota subsp. sativus]WOG91670.1 hypothetical protein DCAR_0310920 [Daucus carota subsp. sativus]